MIKKYIKVSTKHINENTSCGVLLDSIYNRMLFFKKSMNLLSRMWFIVLEAFFSCTTRRKPVNTVMIKYMIYALLK